jgi:Ca2+-binding RTX toxin-like protein
VEGEEEAEAAMTAVRWLGRVVALGLVVVGLAAPVGASAAVTCTFDDASDTLIVQMSADGNVAELQRDAGGGIHVVSQGDIPCANGMATTTTIDTVNVFDTSPSGSTTFSILHPTDFAPGVAPEPGVGQLPEIEFNVLLSGGGLDKLSLFGLDGGVDNWRVGTTGINWNTGGGDPDADLAVFSGIEVFDLHGDRGNDQISAQGGSGAGSPFAATGLRLNGGEDNDTVEGGNAAIGDGIQGGSGDDTLRGFAGNDSISGFSGVNLVDGGPGVDAVSYDHDDPSQPGVTVDLGQAGPQDTGIGNDTLVALESITGSPNADSLIGDGGANRIVGLLGNDTLDGRGGNDELAGAAGVDTASYQQAPAGVTVGLAPTGGTASGGGGDDVLNHVENVTGSPFADSLTGDANPNTITGLGGTDTVRALAGADTVQVRDGGPDTASCGTEIDTATADRQGVDTINPDCENVAFAPADPPGGGVASNDFTFGKVKKNKKKGTAKLTVTVPGPGDLELGKSKRVKGAEKRAAAEGDVKMKLKPKGSAKQRLADDGKARVKGVVTYTPDGGDPKTKTKRVTLARRS